MASRRVLSRGRWTIRLRSPLRSTGRVVAGVGRGMRCTRRVLLAGDLLRIAWMRISLWFLCRRGWWLLGNRVPLLLDVVIQVYLAFITLIINFKIWISFTVSIGASDPWVLRPSRYFSSLCFGFKYSFSYVSRSKSEKRDFFGWGIEDKSGCWWVEEGAR